MKYLLKEVNLKHTETLLVNMQTTIDFSHFKRDYGQDLWFCMLLTKNFT